MQVSLRELLTIVAFVAIGTASLKVGGLLATGFIGLAILLSMMMAITAFVDWGPRRKFAIGFAVCMLMYVLIVYASSVRPQPYSMPTSRWLNAWYEAVVQRKWVDQYSGRELPNFDPEEHSLEGVTFESEHPERRTFMVVGHLLWAIGLGYGGGKFSQYTDARRRRDAEHSSGQGDDSAEKDK